MATRQFRGLTMAVSLVLTASAVSLPISRAQPTDSGADQPATTRLSVSPVPIVVDASDASIFPASWLRVPVSASADPLEEGLGGQAVAVLRAAMAKYPPEVLQPDLRRVYVLGALRYSGVSAGGTNSRTAVYVVYRRSFAPAQLEHLFHAEFSSILLRNHPDLLDAAAWKAVNDADFEYGKLAGGSGVEAIRRGRASLAADRGLLERGFLTEYSMSTLENDFNGFAARLFLGDEGLWSAASEFPRIAAKTDLAIAFYQKRHPQLSREFFQSLRAVNANSTTRPGKSLP